MTPFEKLKGLLGRTWRISTEDGRIFLGTLVCTDKDKNIILTNTDEYRQGQQGGPRYVGMIMVSWKYITKAEVDWTAFDNIRNAGDDDALYT